MSVPTLAQLADFAKDVTLTDVAYAARYVARFAGITIDTPLTKVGEMLMRAQQVLRVPRTGVIDPQTVRAMHTRPRCGLADVIRLGGAQSQWDVGLATGDGLAYAFRDYLEGISRSEQEELFALACQQWSEVCGVKFRRVKNERTANIVVTRSSSRRDGLGTEGATLAYAYLPQGAKYRGQLEIVFDDAETWIKSGRFGILYLNVCCHELGHILGLDHDNDTRPEAIALMDPIYAEDISKPQDHFDKPEAVSRYGEASIVVPGGDWRSDVAKRLAAAADELRSVADIVSTAT